MIDVPINVWTITYLQGSQASRTRFRRSAGGISQPIYPVCLCCNFLGDVTSVFCNRQSNVERCGCGGSMDGGHTTRRKLQPEQKTERAGFVGQQFSCILEFETMYVCLRRVAYRFFFFFFPERNVFEKLLCI